MALRNLSTNAPCSPERPSTSTSVTPSHVDVSHPPCPPRKMPNKRACIIAGVVKDRAATKARIIEAARTVFARRGYDAAGLREIAEVAQASRQSLWDTACSQWSARLSDPTQFRRRWEQAVLLLASMDWLSRGLSVQSIRVSRGPGMDEHGRSQVSEFDFDTTASSLREIAIATRSGASSSAKCPRPSSTSNVAFWHAGTIGRRGSGGVN